MTSDPREVAALRKATADLTAQVASLSEALLQVGELRDRQRELDQRTAEIQHAAVEQHQLTEHVVEHLGNLDEVSDRRQRLLERLRKIMIAGAVLIVAGMISGGVLFHEVDRVNHVITDNCHTRNATIDAAIVREKALAQASPPEQRPAHVLFAQTLESSREKCPS